MRAHIYVALSLMLSNTLMHSGKAKKMTLRGKIEDSTTLLYVNFIHFCSLIYIYIYIYIYVYAPFTSFPSSTAPHACVASYFWLTRRLFNKLGKEHVGEHLASHQMR